MNSISMCSNTLYMSFMDVGCSLRWLSASSFWPTSDPDSKNLIQVVWEKLCKATTICLWTAYQCAQTLCICLIWMWKAVLRWLSASTMTEWHHFEFWLHKWHRTPKSEQSRVGMNVYGCYHMPMDNTSICPNTLYMSNMDVRSSLRWLSASTMT